MLMFPHQSFQILLVLLTQLIFISATIYIKINYSINCLDEILSIFPAESEISRLHQTMVGQELESTEYFITQEP